MIAPTADIHETAQIGEDCHIWPGAAVLPGAKIGAHCSIGRNAEIGRDAEIGEGTRISYGVFLPTRAKVGRGVFIGPGAVFTDDKYPTVIKAFYKPAPPVIEDDAAIGAGAVILPGVRIGQGALVGAGSIVTKNVEPWTVVAGNPARLRGFRGERRDVRPDPASA